MAKNTYSLKKLLLVLSFFLVRCSIIRCHKGSSVCLNFFSIRFIICLSYRLFLFSYSNRLHFGWTYWNVSLCRCCWFFTSFYTHLYIYFKNIFSFFLLLSKYNPHVFVVTFKRTYSSTVRPFKFRVLSSFSPYKREAVKKKKITHSTLCVRARVGFFFLSFFLSSFSSLYGFILSLSVSRLFSLSFPYIRRVLMDLHEMFQWVINRTVCMLLKT